MSLNYTLGRCDRCGRHIRNVRTFDDGSRVTLNIHTPTLCDAVRASIETRAVDDAVCVVKSGIPKTWGHWVAALDAQLAAHLDARVREELS